MTTMCTSCGALIPSSSIIYKCRQCVAHFVCELCETKDHNRTSATSHTLYKISVSSIQPTTAVSTASRISSMSIVDTGEDKTKTSSKPSSIFISEEFLYSALGYCGCCYRIVAGDKDPTFQCQQCPNLFEVCQQCMPLMPTHHPSVHIFEQKPFSYWAKVAHDMWHSDVLCDGCGKKNFNGKRYQCQECPPSYDLCEDCIKTKHREHEMKYLQHPLLHSNNQQALAERTLGLAKKYGEENPNWRDPLTGWNKSDAEQIIERSKKVRQTHENRSQENYRRALRNLDASQQRLEDARVFDYRLRMINMMNMTGTKL